MRSTAVLGVAAVLILVPTGYGAEPSEEAVRRAMGKALPLLAKGAEGHITQRTCFACHNQALPLLAFTTALERGFTIRSEDIKKQTKFIADFLDKNRDNYLKGKGQGGQADTAGYALLTLEWGGYKADATTGAVVEYLLQRNEDVDHWKPVSNRPPSEASDFTVNFLGLRALRKWGTEAQKQRIDKRVNSVRAWLLKSKAKDTEDRVFRLLALKEVGAEKKVLEEATQELLRIQRKDGGWGQLASLDSDAYATGSALVALRLTGTRQTGDPEYQRGVAYLLKTQLADGSWLVKSRSKPFQTYYESGFPHEKNQFISMAASGWAATALALTLPSTASSTR